MGAGLGSYTVRRLLWAIPVLFLVSFFVFTIVRLAPGSPVDRILGQRYDPEVAKRLEAKYGYDQPIVVQYFKYMENVIIHHDIGVSTLQRDFTASEVILPKLWVSSQIGLMALIVAFGLGIPVGIYAALARGTFLDPLTISFWLAIDAFPSFVIAWYVQWLFALKLGWLSLTWDGVWSPNIIAPVMIIGLPGVAGIARLMRASIIGVLGDDYIRTARAKGLRESSVVFGHILRNAMLPMVTVIGLALPGIIGGSLFVERIFGIPGIGAFSLAAVVGQDYDPVLAIVLLGTVLFVLANVAIDVMYAVIDPRIRVGARRK